MFDRCLNSTKRKPSHRYATFLFLHALFVVIRTTSDQFWRFFISLRICGCNPECSNWFSCLLLFVFAPAQPYNASTIVLIQLLSVDCVKQAFSYCVLDLESGNGLFRLPHPALLQMRVGLLVLLVLSALLVVSSGEALKPKKHHPSGNHPKCRQLAGKNSLIFPFMYGCHINDPSKQR